MKGAFPFVLDLYQNGRSCGAHNQLVHYVNAKQMLTAHMEIEDFLPKLPLFKGLDGTQIGRIAANSSELIVPRGTALYHRGDRCKGLHVVFSGFIKVSFQTSRGTEMVIELAGPRMSFGEAALFSGRPYIAEAEALVHSRVLYVPKEALMSEVERDPRFSRRLIAALGDRLYRRLTELEQYVLASGTERVISYLLNGESGHAPRTAERIQLPTSKRIIASRLNLTHEHFSRILRDLMRAGLIEVDGREIRILNKKRLHAYAA